MKSAILLAGLFLWSPTIFAFPEAWDKTIYQGTWTFLHPNDNEPASHSLTVLTALIPPKAPETQFNEFTGMLLDGKIYGSGDDKKDFENVFTESNADRLLTSGDCESKVRGTLETITVPAGTYLTCHILSRDEDTKNTQETWIGKVPFGTVKAVGEFEGFAKYSYELVKITKQKPFEP